MIATGADIKDKEKKAVKEELRLEMEDGCRVEYDDFMDCQVETGDMFALWRCRKQQHQVWECEKKYKNKAYRRKREIEILEARQQQGMAYAREVIWYSSRHSMR